jgi:hypothetical protein
MSDPTPFLRSVYQIGPAVLAMIRWHASGDTTEEQLVEHIDHARRATGDMITDAIAVYLACAMLGALEIVPTPGSGPHGFTVTTDDGRPVDVDDIPAGVLARARMVTAACNGDALAARDVFVAYRNTHDDVSQFLADFVIGVAGEAHRHGLVIR